MSDKSETLDLATDLVGGFRKLRLLVTCAACVEHGVFDALPQWSEQSKSVDEVAKQCGVDTHMLQRFLRLMSGIGISKQVRPGCYAHTATSRQLLAGQRMAHVLRMRYCELIAAYSCAAETLRTGRSGFSHAFGGLEIFDYLDKHPVRGAIFNRLIQSLSSPVLLDWIASVYNWSQFDCLVDVGGSLGHLVRAIAEKHPTLGCAVVYDLPGVVDKARAAWSDKPDQVHFVGGDFLKEGDLKHKLGQIKPGGVDCVTLKWILHDWSDDECAVILRNIRAAMKTGAVLAVVEDDFIDDSDSKRNTPQRVNSSDVNMALLATGRERSLAEYDTLLGHAGFKRSAVKRLDSGTHSSVMIIAQAVDVAYLASKL